MAQRDSARLGFSKKFVQLLIQNKESADKRAQMVHFEKKDAKRRSKFKNVFEHIFGPVEGQPKRQSSNLSVDLPANTRMKSSLLQNLSFRPSIQLISSKHSNRREGSRALICSNPNSSIADLQTDRAGLSMCLVSPSISVARLSKLAPRLKAQDSSQVIQLSQLRSKADYLAFPSEKFCIKRASQKKKSLNVSFTRRLAKMIPPQIGDKLAQENYDGYVADDDTTLINNKLLESRLPKKIANTDAVVIKFHGAKSEFAPKHAPASQFSFIIDGNHKYEDLATANPLPRNFCDYPVEAQKKLARAFRPNRKDEFFNVNYTNVYPKARKATKGVKRAEPATDLQLDNEVSETQFSRWQVREEKKPGIKIRPLKNKKRKGKLLNQSHAEVKSMFDFGGGVNKELMFPEEAAGSKWIELIDKLIGLPSLMDVESCGYYIHSLGYEAAMHNKQSDFKMEDLIQRLRMDLLSGKKFAFVFRYY